MYKCNIQLQQQGVLSRDRECYAVEVDEALIPDQSKDIMQQPAQTIHEMRKALIDDAKFDRIDEFKNSDKVEDAYAVCGVMK